MITETVTLRFEPSSLPAPSEYWIGTGGRGDYGGGGGGGGN